jgi:hypothetical protein
MRRVERLFSPKLDSFSLIKSLAPIPALVLPISSRARWGSEIYSLNNPFAHTQRVVAQVKRSPVLLEFGMGFSVGLFLVTTILF